MKFLSAARAIDAIRFLFCFLKFSSKDTRFLGAARATAAIRKV